MNEDADGLVRRFRCRRCDAAFDFLWVWGPGPWYCNDCAEARRLERGRRREQRRQRRLRADPALMRLCDLKEMASGHGHAPIALHRALMCQTCWTQLGRHRGPAKGNFWLATPAAGAPCCNSGPRAL